MQSILLYRSNGYSPDVSASRKNQGRSRALREHDINVNKKNRTDSSGK